LSKKNFIKNFATLFFGIISFANYANADDLESIFEKDRFYDTNKSLRAGSLQWEFITDVSATHNDNIYATRDNTIEDWIYNIKPYVGFESNWTRHELYMNGDVDIGIYDEYTNENYIDRSLNGGGIVDFTKGTNLEYGVSYNYLHEDRGSPDDRSSIDPTEYTFINYNTKLNYAEESRVRGYVEANIDSYDYEHAYRRISATNPTIIKIDNSYRKRNTYKGTTRLDYEFIPNYTVFALGSFNEVDYRGNTKNGIRIVRDSKGYETRVGGTYNVTEKIDLEAYIGYLSQDYRNDALEDVDDYYGGGYVLWNVTSGTSLIASAKKRVAETTLLGASANLATKYTGSVEQELTRDLLLSAIYTTLNYDYQYKLSGLYRQDDIEIFEFTGRYYINRHFLLEAGFSYRDNESSSVNSNFDETKTYFNLQYKY
jgi:hypothetical protein